MADTHIVNIIIICINLRDQMQTTDIMFCKSPGNVPHITSKYRLMFYIQTEAVSPETTSVESVIGWFL